MNDPDFLKDNPWLRVLKKRGRDSTPVNNININNKEFTPVNKENVLHFSTPVNKKNYLNTNGRRDYKIMQFEKYDKNVNVNSMGNIYNNKIINNQSDVLRLRCNTNNNKIINNSIYSSFRNKKLIVVSTRLSSEDLERLAFIQNIRGIQNTSKIIREAIQLYYGLLKNNENIRFGNIVIQHPVVNLQIAEARSNLSIDPEILRKELNVLREEKNRLLEITRFYEKEIEKYKKDSRELLKKLKDVSLEKNILHRKLQQVKEILQDEYYDTPSRKIHAIRNILDIR